VVRWIFKGCDTKCYSLPVQGVFCITILKNKVNTGSADGIYVKHSGTEKYGTEN
jgi:hypothetical protein